MKIEIDSKILEDFLTEIENLEKIQSDTRVGHILFLVELKKFQLKIKKLLK